MYLNERRKPQDLDSLKLVEQSYETDLYRACLS